jgi:hypothetical protein
MVTPSSRILALVALASLFACHAGARPDATPAPAAPEAVAAAPTAADTEAPRPQTAPSGNPFDAPTIFAAKSTVGRSTSTLQLQSRRAYRAVRAGEHFAAGFLTEGEHLNAGRLLGNTRTASISRLTAITSATTFAEVAVTPPPGDTLQVGDLLLSYEVPRRIDPWGDVVRPTGLLRVTAVGDPGDNVMAQVTEVFQSITSGQSVIRVTPFTPNRQRATAVDSGIVGSVIDVREPSELVTPDDALFIDRGAEDGVQLGDIFQISGTTTAASGIGRVVQNEVQVLIVHLRPHTATGIVIQIDRPDVRPGATAQQIRRMPS